MTTKLELQQANTRLADENHQLKLENAALRTQLSMQTEIIEEAAALKAQLEISTPKYPFVDKFGRSYRLEGNIRCFAPAK